MPLQKCINVVMNEHGLAICAGSNCLSVLGSLCVTGNDNKLLLSNVREVLCRPLGSYIQGKSMHNVNTCRMMYGEMLERGSFKAPRTPLDIPHHLFEPRNAAMSDGSNIVQIAPSLECPTSETSNGIPRIRIRDFASLDLFGCDQRFLGRIVLNDHRDACLEPKASSVHAGNSGGRHPQQDNSNLTGMCFVFHLPPMYFVKNKLFCL